MGRVVSIVGPTAAGKTAVSLRLAQQFNGEIICADSRTVYSGMDIGTAKPSAEEQAIAPHWLLDQIEPGQSYSVAEFQKAAYAAIDDILGRDKLPIVVGGSGMYVDAVLYGYELGGEADSALRAELEALDDAALQGRLRQVDPEIIEHTDMNNRRRVIRAIERAGQRPEKSKKPLYESIIVGINPGKERLHTNITRRNKTMLKTGLIAETEQLVAKYGAIEPLNTVPYKQVVQYLRGELTLEQAEAQMDTKDWQLARRQLTWFKRNAEISWFADGDSAFSHLKAILAA